MSEFIIIDTVVYQVPIVTLKRKADILDKYAYRSEDGVLHREVIGTYHNFTLEIGVINDPTLYNRLFDVLSAPVESHQVELPHDHVSFRGYFSSVQDEIKRLTDTGAVYRGLSCNLTAMVPRRRA
jgi:hypothetical protein